MPVRFAETVQQLVPQFILCQKEAVITERKTAVPLYPMCGQLSSEKLPTLVPALIVENRR